MLKRITAKCPVVFCAVGLAVLLSSKDSRAVPSFARQTGLNCTVCHTVWPQLTHFGRVFKLDGYTFSTESSSGRWYPPIAGMFQASYTTLNDNKGVLTNGVAPFDDSEDSATDKGNLPQQASLFYGGRIISHLGALAQLTYDGTANDVALDNTDIRYARTFPLGGKHLTIGATLNNAPTVEDLWNTTPVWRFRFASSAVAPTPAAAPLIDGTLDQQVGGIGAYASWANFLYGAVSLYRTTNDGITRPLGAGTDPDTITDGAVPYWRLALYHAWNKHAFEIGTLGLKADVYPGITDTGPTNSFTDYGFDAEYQFIAEPHLFTLRATWIHEDQDWDASYILGGTSNRSDTLKTLKINAGYFYRSKYGTFGGYAGYFSVTGDTDPVLYAPDPVDGSRTGSPDSKGFVFQGVWVFKEKYQFSLQYTIYDKFNGSGTNYDGFGRDASDNNTLYLLAWLMF
jgi:hypothetical protein